MYNTFSTLLIFGLTVLIVYFVQCYKYWERRGVPFLTPRFPYGNLESYLLRGIGLGNVTKKWYDILKTRGHNKYGGVYVFTRPMLLLIDPEMIKNILVTDFNHFVNRGIYYNERTDPLNVNLFSVEGAKWKSLRAKLTSTFTSGKMKIMFHTVMECCNNMEQRIKELTESGDAIEMKEICAKLTTDVIGSCAFGIDCNSFKNPDAEFRKNGKKVFDPSKFQSLQNLFAFACPRAAKFIGIRNVPKEITDFFQNAVEETVRFRKNNSITRKDFLQLLMGLLDSNDQEEKITMTELAAQAFVIFLAGFETSSSTMTFCIYELTKNVQIQKKVRDEINTTIKYYNNEISYDSLNQMKYLDQVVSETLRKYPTLATLNRVCIKPYTMPGTDFTIEKDTGILIPVYGLHKDPEYYPDPERFDPERFSEDNKQKRHPFCYLPFGDGPRNCIGLRFGLMQVKAGLAVLLKNYEFSLNSNTVDPIQLDPYTFVTSTLNPIWMNARKVF